jgi:hypothetical protein
MDIGKRALNLATALVLGATIVGLTAEPAAAEEKTPPKDDGTRCVYHQIDGHIDFYMPGDEHPTSGKKKVCGADGTWQDVSTSQSGRPWQVLPGNLPSGTFTQTP